MAEEAARKPAGDASSLKPLHVRTPLIESMTLSKIAGCEVLMKMENVQPPGAFKIRGIGHTAQMAQLNGFTRAVASSGGNAGMAAAYACRKINMPINIYIPGSTPSFTKDALEAQGAEVEVVGQVWDHADAKARQRVAESPNTIFYIHPFEGQHTWDGHASLVRELAEDMDTPPDLVILSVGGGGLLCGISQGMAEVGWDKVPILAMETVGADCMYKAVEAGKLVTLPDITSIAKCLGALTLAERAWQAYQERPIISEVVTDQECLDTCFRYLNDHKVMIEPACGAALAAIYSGKIKKLQDEGKLGELKKIVVIVCGGTSVTMDLMNKWKKDLGM